MENKPLVSIGMPLYNDEDFLEESLNSLLNQTFSNFELIISDDASTDNSSEICKKYKDNDKKIKYYRNEKNLGEIANFNKALSFAKGKYFMWASGHDIWKPSFIEKCVEKLESEPSAVACTTFYNHVDTKGNFIKRNTRVFNTINNSKFVGFIKAIWILFDPVIYGVIKTKELKKTRGYLYVLGPDHVVRVELSLFGKFTQIPEPLFSFRKKRKEDTKQADERRLKSWKQFNKMNWFYLKLPHLATVHEYAKSTRLHCDNLFSKIIYSIIAYLVRGLRYGKLIIVDIYQIIKI
jgi:glycosyltransferase involved in cell wall biosynthesis